MNQIIEESQDILEFQKLKELLSQYVVSDLGRDLILELKPLYDIEALERLLEICSEMKEIYAVGGGLPLSGLTDIRPILRRASISGAILEPPDLLAVASCAAASRNCKSFIQKKTVGARHAVSLHISKFAQALPVLVELEEAIKSCIGDEGEILDNASDELRRIRRQIANLREKIKEKLEAIIHSSQYQKAIQEPLITLRNDRYVIPIKQDYKGTIQGVVQGQSSSGATLFFEPIPAVELNNELHKLQYDENREIRRILADLSQKVGSEVKRLKEAISILAELDLNAAKARFSLDLSCSKPILNDRGYINLIKARHPLLEVKLRQTQDPRPETQDLEIQNPKSKIQNPKEVVPIDIYIGDDFDTLVITGPNTGGKTVALKTVGLLTLMAQCGLQIPAADGSEIGVFKGIYADIGDEQSIEQNLSTFSSHISRIIRILEPVDNRALVLLDEIGAGTDPTEGAALAIAILNYLQAKGAKTLITTHYGVLKAYTHSKSNMKNASVEFDWITLQPTYRLQVGVPGSSNALKIADRLGLPKEIIELAKSHIDERTIEVEELLTSMEKERRKLQTELMAVEHKASAATQSQVMYDQLYTQLKSERQKIRRQAEQEVSEIVKNARRLLENAIAQVKKEQASKTSVLQVYRTINQIQKELTEFQSQNQSQNLTDLTDPSGSRGSTQTQSLSELELEALNLGDWVLVKSLNRVGEVVQLPDSKDSKDSKGDAGIAGIRVGSLKLAVPISDLGKLAKQAKPAESAPNARKAEGSSNLIRLGYAKKSKISSHLNVRGLIVEDAIEIVDKYLDDALLAGLESVSIIHGKGTGALKNAIRQFLEAQSHVKSFRAGELNEGGDGVTIVKLKD